MTRKKFIKILMSNGMSRNEAADCATLAQEAGRPHLLVSGDLLCFCRHCFGNPLGWPKMRRHIIHGHAALINRVCADIDEVHKMDGTAVAAAIKAGTAAKSAPVVIVGTSATMEEMLKHNFPPAPGPAAGCAYAIDLTPVEEPVRQWTKENPHAKTDALDALTYAIEAQRIYAGGGGQ